MTLDVDQALGLAVQVSILIAALAAGVVWLKRWIKSTVSEPLLAQVGPNGGVNQDPTRHLIEQIQESQDSIKQGQVEIIDRLDMAETRADRNYSLALSAQTLAQHTSDRLDRWIAQGIERKREIEG